MRCIHNNGPEFMGAPFMRMLEVNSIKDVPTTVKNPQANAICEQLHQSIGNTLRAHLSSNIPQDVEQANNVMDTCFTTAGYASRSAIHRSLKISPGAIVFQRDMVMDIPLLADLHALHQRRQLIIDK